MYFSRVLFSEHFKNLPSSICSSSIVPVSVSVSFSLSLGQQFSFESCYGKEFYLNYDGNKTALASQHSNLGP